MHYNVIFSRSLRSLYYGLILFRHCLMLNHAYTTAHNRRLVPSEPLDQKHPDVRFYIYDRPLTEINVMASFCA